MLEPQIRPTDIEALAENDPILYGRGLENEDGVTFFFLTEVPLDENFVDEGGNPWGPGQPVWRFLSQCMNAEGFIREPSREDAKARVRGIFPFAEFFDSEDPEQGE